MAAVTICSDFGAQKNKSFSNALDCCCCLVAKSRLTLCDPMDCSPPGSSVYGISQASTLEWVVISFFRGCSRPRDQICAYLAGGFSTHLEALLH